MSLARALTRPIVPILSALAVGGGLYALAAKRLSPPMPDIALEAGIELTSKRRRLLALGPHPGDLEFFVGGSLFLLSQNKSDVTMAVFSAGERAGGATPNMGEIRKKEQAAAASVLGAKLRQFSLPDGGFQHSRDLFDAVEKAWRQCKPDVIFAIDPRGLLIRPNPDHAALGAAIVELARKGAAGDARVYLYGTPKPNVLVDITEVIQEKVSALQCHRSQLKGPDSATRWAVRASSRLTRGRTPAMYTEALYRLV